MNVAMRRTEIARVLAEHRDELAREHRVRSLSLFGSVARDEAGSESDVDVLVELQPPASLFTLGGLQQYLETLFGREVDLVTRNGVKRQLRDRISSEEVLILETEPGGRLVPARNNRKRLESVHQRGREVEMADHDWKMRLEDILGAIDAIEQFTAGTTLDAFAEDRLRIDAVLYNFVIIGEAERHIPREVEARYPAVPWAKMRGMRNVLIHDYPSVDLAIVWETARDHLPPLVPELRKILDPEQ